MVCKFKKGDYCICRCKLVKFTINSLNEREVISKRNLRVRITNINDNNIPNYRVYNIDYDRYEIIGEIYLILDRKYYRDIKINNILK